MASKVMRLGTLWKMKWSPLQRMLMRRPPMERRGREPADDAEVMREEEALDT